jgi:uroporphyrin-3 C-methyltransferase
VNDASSPAAEPRTVVPAPADAVRARPAALALSGPIVLLLTLVSVVALALAWRADQRVRSSERELVKRQQDSADRVAEAMLFARQAQDGMRDATAKVALLEARLNEVALQRGQLEDLVRSVARSRDENLVTDIEAAMRAAVQQSALTGSAEPLVATLKQSDERLARANQPRLEPVRRAIARDLDRSRRRASPTSRRSRSRSTRWCAWSTSCRCSRPPSRAATSPPRTGRRSTEAPAPAPPPRPPKASATGCRASWPRRRFFADNIWSEIRSLVRITPIAHPRRCWSRRTRSSSCART